MNTERGNRGYAAIGLCNPKNPVNVACTLRAAGCYSAAMVAIAGIEYRHNFADTQRAYRQLPLIQTNDLRSVIPFDCTPVAIEITNNARDLPAYTHPERAFYVFGPEDGSISPEVLAWCKHTVKIPTAYCMNLAATVNVVLYDRLAKQLTK